MFEWKTTVIAAVLCACASHVGTYPSGAPQETCGTMVPKHGELLPQTSVAPFAVSPSVSRVLSGEKMRLMLTSRQGVSFAGFMLQARSPVVPGEPLGTFTNLPDMAKILTCGSGIKNTATHKNRTLKKSLEFEWEAPPNFEGPINFNATFVQNGATFWVGVESDDVQVVKRSVDESDRPPVGISTTKSPIRITTIPNYTLEPEVQAEKATSPIYDGCFDKKLCFGLPEGCIDSQSCLRMGTVFVKGDTFEFELFAAKDMDKSPKYVALGLSDSKKMPKASVTECSVTPDGTKLDVYMSRNDDEPYGNKRLNELSDKVSLKEAKSDNGNIYCKFTREKITTVQDKIYDLEKDSYFLLLATGTQMKDNNARIGFHDISFDSNEEALSLTSVGIVGASSKLLYRLHGAFMIVAWIGSTSVGILLARYFKQTWVGSQMCGKDQWFAWHRTFMVTTWTLTCAGFIIIFVEIQDWYGETSNPHAVLGCITTGLAFIQPFGAALRPTPDSPKRPIFNWLHWLVGNCAHILAIVTMFFAVKLTKAELPPWTDWILVSYVAFHVFMHLLFSVLGCFSERQWEKRISDFPLKEMSSSRSPLHSVDRKRDWPLSRPRKFLLAIYLIVIIGLTVFLVVVATLAPIEQHWAFKGAKNLLFTQN